MRFLTALGVTVLTLLAPSLWAEFPQINLNGDTSVRIPKDSVYQEITATATDPEDGELTELSAKTRRPVPEVSIVHVEGELFFAAADLFYEQMRRVGEDPNLRVLVLKLLNAHHLDATSVMAMEELLDYLKEKNCHVLLCEVRRDVLRILKNSGVLSRMNRKNIFPHTISNPTLSTAKAIKRAKLLTTGEETRVTIYADQINKT